MLTRSSLLNLRSLRVRVAAFFAVLISVLLMGFGGAVYVTARIIEAQEVEPQADKERELALVRRLLLLSLGMGIPLGGILAAAGSAWMTRRTLRAIGDIVRVASEVGPERLSQRLPLHAQDDAEIRSLVAALNQMLERVEQSVTALRRFTADAAHELRTPLAVLCSRLEIALRRPRDEAQLRGTMEETLEGLSSLCRLVELLLTLARSDAGELACVRGPVNIHTLLLQLVSLYEGVASERELVLQLDCDSQLTISTDVLLLHRAVANLLDNACKFALPGGTVCLQATQFDEALWLRISDNGPGFVEPDPERLFERFYRCESHRGVVDGFGLGLPLVRELVRVLGGAVSLRRLDSGGTEAAIRLPV